MARGLPVVYRLALFAACPSAQAQPGTLQQIRDQVKRDADGKPRKEAKRDTAETDKGFFGPLDLDAFSLIGLFCVGPQVALHDLWKVPGYFPAYPYTAGRPWASSVAGGRCSGGTIICRSGR